MDIFIPEICFFSNSTEFRGMTWGQRTVTTVLQDHAIWHGVDLGPPQFDQTC